jgi:hypothetical protein
MRMDVYLRGYDTPFVTLGDIEMTRDDFQKFSPPRLERRVMHFPDAKCVVVIPPKHEALVVYKFDAEAELANWPVDYLVVTTVPPSSFKKGQTFTY